jgi:hypothetical protein
MTYILLIAVPSSIAMSTSSSISRLSVHANLPTGEVHGKTVAEGYIVHEEVFDRLAFVAQGNVELPAPIVGIMLMMCQRIG